MIFCVFHLIKSLFYNFAFTVKCRIFYFIILGREWDQLFFSICEANIKMSLWGASVSIGSPFGQSVPPEGLVAEPVSLLLNVMCSLAHASPDVWGLSLCPQSKTVNEMTCVFKWAGPQGFCEVALNRSWGFNDVWTVLIRLGKIMKFLPVRRGE